MSTWPGLEAWTPRWGILSTWLPSGERSGGPEEVQSARPLFCASFPNSTRPEAMGWFGSLSSNSYWT